jgi:LmbE family N-acetylglucosaminyl deacetylase
MPTSVLLPPGGQRILVVQAHPDDAEHICGGTIALLADEGKDIHYLMVTRGDKGSDDPEMTTDRLAAIREQEQKNAAGVLGVQTITFLDGYYDGEVEANISLRRDIVFVVRQWKPDIVMTFDPWRKNEIHPDHRAVAMCTLDAISCARGGMYYREQLKTGITPHSVKQIYYFNTDRPNHWVDITAVVDKKAEALRCHTSQTSKKDIEAWITRKGLVAGLPHKMKVGEDFHHYVYN